MSNVSVNTRLLRFELHPSNYCAAILIAQHLLVIFFLLCCWMPLMLLLPIVFICLTRLIYFTNLVLQKSSRAIITIAVNSNEWCLFNREGQELSARLLGHSFNSYYLIVLNFKVISENKKLSVILMPDSMDTTSWRRLRAHLAFATV